MRLSNNEVALAFKSFIRPNRSCNYMRCLYCGDEAAKNTSRQFNHLIRCQSYLSACKAKGKVTPATRKASEACNDSTDEPTQKKLKTNSTTYTRQRLLEKKATRMIVYNARPFQLFQDTASQDFLLSLDNSFKIPDRTTFAGTLLEEIYATTMEDVKQYISTQKYLNFVIDESSNILHERVINLCCNTPNGALHIKSEVVDLGAKCSAEWIFGWVRKEIKHLLDSDFKRVNSLATDTCSTMRSLWELIRKDEDLQHVFTVPCDSHGLQLLIKDILEQISWFKTVFASAQSISTKFRTSPKQLSILRRHQKTKKAFSAAVITRWGTQLAVAQSVKDNQEAIEAYCLDRDADVNAAFRSQAIAGPFFQQLGHFLHLFKPLHEAQKMSESDRARLGYVSGRWQSIYQHFCDASVAYPQAKEVLDQVFHPRMAKQVVPMHWAAYYLDPAHAGSEISVECQKQVLDFIREHMPADREAAALQSYFSYYHKEDEFASTNYCWQYTNKPNLFWSSMRVTAPDLADLARRLHFTQANSVPSERSFSIAKLIHSRTRASTDPKRVDMQTAVYINQRVFDRHKGKYHEPFDWNQLDEQERLEWENSIVEHEYVEANRRVSEVAN